MSTFKIEFETDNDVFQDDQGRHGISEALAIIGEEVRYGEKDGHIRDSNGNTVGKWEWTS